MTGPVYQGRLTKGRLLIKNARVVTPVRAAAPLRGRELGTLTILPATDVLIADGLIAAVGTSLKDAGAAEFEASGRVLMPAFVDCHTHACWAGSRLDEWEKKLAGATYLDILAAGGGIMSTVRSVRAASQEELKGLLVGRLRDFLSGGTTTVEVKSGYGLTTQDELKMLRAIKAAAPLWRGTLVPTALLGHAMDDDDPRFVERVISETLPAVAAEFSGITVDAFCEKSAWPLDDAVSLFEAAKEKHPIRVHTDQYNPLGMTEAAIRINAVSVDHLEASTPGTLEVLAKSRTIGVGLPICGLHLDGRYANLRALVDAGGAVAIATNSNPGSAPTTSMPLAIGAAVRHCRLTPGEAIAAATINAAFVLGLIDRGTVTPGQRADMIVLKHTDERALAYELGGNPVDTVICGGHFVS